MKPMLDAIREVLTSEEAVFAFGFLLGLVARHMFARWTTEHRVRVEQVADVYRDFVLAVANMKFSAGSDAAQKDLAASRARLAILGDSAVVRATAEFLRNGGKVGETPGFTAIIAAMRRHLSGHQQTGKDLHGAYRTLVLGWTEEEAGAREAARDK